MLTANRLKSGFFKEYLIRRRDFDPKSFGVAKTQDEFKGMCVDFFNETFNGSITIGEICLRPRTALAFCDDFKKRYAWFDVPDDIILRSIMQATSLGHHKSGSISEALHRLYEAGGNAWDGVDNPDAFIAEMRGL